MTTLSGQKPGNFHGYWQDTLAELAALPPAPEVQEIPMRSTDFATAYGVRLTSIGPYRLYAYLSLPHGDGPFPARYHLPRYGSAVDLVPHVTSNSQRREHVTFAICVSGQRLADQPYAAAFPGLLTDGIDGPAGYVYRGIMSDCVRGLEYWPTGPKLTARASPPSATTWRTARRRCVHRLRTWSARRPSYTTPLTWHGAPERTRWRRSTTTYA